MSQTRITWDEELSISGKVFSSEELRKKEGWWGEENLKWNQDQKRQEEYISSKWSDEMFSWKLWWKGRERLQEDVMSICSFSKSWIRCSSWESGDDDVSLDYDDERRLLFFFHSFFFLSAPLKIVGVETRPDYHLVSMIVAAHLFLFLKTRVNKRQMMRRRGEKEWCRQ